MYAMLGSRISLSYQPDKREKKEKMTQGWVVYGGMRHAEPQREMFSRSYKLSTRRARVVVSTKQRNFFRETSRNHQEASTRG